MVHVPIKPGITWNVIEELRPGLWTLREYSGTTVERMPGEVVVVLEERAGPKGQLAGSLYERRLIVVYVREVEWVLGRRPGQPEGARSRAGAKCEPGKWIVATAQDRAVKWAEGLVGRKLVPSRWAEVGITP